MHSMLRSWAAASLMFSAVYGYAAGTASQPSKLDEKKAATEASVDADQWAAKDAAKAVQEEKNAAKPDAAQMPGMAQPAADSENPASPTPGTQPAAKTEAKPVADSTPATHPNYNEMVGSVVSIDADQRLLRLAVEGGYNVQFSYDHKTAVLNGGKPILPTELYFGDKVQVRYAGKELYAVEIERFEKVPRTFQE
jgi:hypothetical protein